MPALPLRRLLPVAAALALAACAGERANVTPPPPLLLGPPVEPGRPADASRAASPASRPSTSATPSVAALDAPPPPTAAEEVAPEERPGLATSWGEARDSHVEEVPFVRDESPLALARLHYDDASGVAALATRARAALPRPAPIPVAGGLSLSVVDESGAPLPALFLDGRADGRVFVVGESGHRYALRVRNDTDRRLEVVASVDGRDVVDGRPARLDKRGYLVAPFSTLTIEGFRTSLDEVAAFRFGSVADSYAARTGDAADVGVIGLAFFAERGSTPLATIPREDRRSDEADRRLRARAFADERFAPPPVLR